jgi:hypothetical protein
MTQRTRKLIGVPLIIASIIAWSWLATALYLGLLQETPWYVHIPYFCVAGIGWVLPAMAIIRWMAKPD